MIILENVLQDIQKHAEQGYPEEICGLLLATKTTLDTVVAHLKMVNVYPGAKNDRYSIDPFELYRVDRDASSRGLVVTGVYHSHPEYPAIPSGFDLEHAFPWYRYLIASVVNGKAKEIRCWTLVKDRTAFMEENIVVMESRS